MVVYRPLQQDLARFNVSGIQNLGWIVDGVVQEINVESGETTDFDLVSLSVILISCRAIGLHVVITRSHRPERLLCHPGRHRSDGERSLGLLREHLFGRDQHLGVY